MLSSFRRAVALAGETQSQYAINDAGSNQITSKGMEFLLKGRWRLKCLNLGTLKLNQLGTAWESASHCEEFNGNFKISVSVPKYVTTRQQ